jgi:hypothetical protein
MLVPLLASVGKMWVQLYTGGRFYIQFTGINEVQVEKTGSKMFQTFVLKTLSLNFNYYMVSE